MSLFKKPHKKKVFRAGLATFVVLNLILCVVLMFMAAEIFFFDRLLYKKSPLHGYTPEHDFDWNLQAFNSNFFLKHRTEDLFSLFNDPDQIQLSDEEFNVAIIGDSYAYGQGVLYHQTFPQLLTKKKVNGKNITVHNYSMPGDGLIEHFAKFSMLQSLDLDYDSIIVTYLSNDVLLEERAHRYQNLQQIYDQLSSVCTLNWVDVEWHTQNIDWKIFTKEVIYYNYFLDGNQCVYKTIVRGMQPYGKAPITFFSYNSVSEANNPIENSLLMDFKKKLNQNNIGLLMVNSKYSSAIISDKERHPSKSAHEQYASFLHNFLIEKFSDQENLR